MRACRSCNTGRTFLRVVVFHNISENFLNLFKLCVPRFDKQNKQRNLRGDGAWHNSPSSRGPPMQPNQLSVICVACHLSFLHSHLPALLLSSSPSPKQARTIVTGPSLTQLKWHRNCFASPPVRAHVTDVVWLTVAARQKSSVTCH